MTYALPGHYFTTELKKLFIQTGAGCVPQLLTLESTGLKYTPEFIHHHATSTREAYMDTSAQHTVTRTQSKLLNWTVDASCRDVTHARSK